jgi:hypothetical protein
MNCNLDVRRPLIGYLAVLLPPPAVEAGQVRQRENMLHCTEVSQQTDAKGQERPICAAGMMSASPRKATRSLRRTE